MACCCKTHSTRAETSHLRSVKKIPATDYGDYTCDFHKVAFVCAVSKKHYPCAEHIGHTLDVDVVRNILIRFATYPHSPEAPVETFNWMLTYAAARGVDLQQVFIYHAVCCLNPEYIDCFVQHGVDPGYVNPASGCTALFMNQCTHDDHLGHRDPCHCDQSYGFSSNVLAANINKLLGYGLDINHVTNIDWPGQLRAGQSFVENGVEFFNRETIAVIMAAGFDIAKHANSIVVSVVHLYHGFDMLCDVLRYAGPHISGYRVVHALAATRNSLNTEYMRSILRKLQKYKVDLNARDDQGNTPLHTAARFASCSNIMTWLMVADADAQSVNNDGLKPIDVLADIDDIDVHNARYCLTSALVQRC